MGFVIADRVRVTTTTTGKGTITLAVSLANIETFNVNLINPDNN